MRLINADKLHYKKVWIRHEYDEKADVVVFAREIDKAEKIEAIPIKWIKDEWLKRENNTGTIEFFPQPTFEEVMEWLIEDWGKENG